ncbi:F0F1 ATP synthase subunit delta [Salinicola rhizosphaerae]|uniref:ATP synthase subunit delta n=1 Tax=Salinicola rhizosphaerae TaxID=1443141 RepID=A0ABQ3DTF5_9GAMM|nr:F0F1 ATP synthase subunit delta [Salinicola rhizosphaerae]GHB13941.1 ATP synthase subunit delta [Salinicola rhizosphaerae]
MAQSSSETVARPYAKAAFEFARDQQALQAWSQSLSLAAAAASDADVGERILGNPRLTQADKTRLLLEVCGDDAFDERVENFLRLVGEKDRLAALPDIFEEFEVLRAQEEKRVDVTIVSAFELDDAQQTRLAEALKKRLNREISITTQVDRELLGGVILRTGDTVIDGSVRGRLQRLREALTA